MSKDLKFRGIAKKLNGIYRVIPVLALVSLSSQVFAAPRPFVPVFFFNRQSDFASVSNLPVFAESIPVYVIPRLPKPDIRPFAKHAEYRKKYVRRVEDAERRQSPYSLEDLMPDPRATVDSDYARSGRPFFVYEPVSRPLYFIPGDGCPLADRAAYGRWKSAHHGFLGFNSLWEMDSDTMYFERFWDRIEDKELKRDLQAGLEPPHARGKGHLVSWTREMMRRLKDFHWGEGRIWPMCSNDMGFEHLFAANGAAGLWYEATTQSLGAWNCASAFLRGAARQWNLPCGWYMAQYYTGHARSGEFRKGDSNWFAYNHPDPKRAKDRRHRGAGRSQHRRQALFGWLAGANYMQMEGWTSFYRTWENGRIVPSESALDFNEIYMLSKTIDRGESYTPLAVLTPLAEPSSSFYRNEKLIEPETQKTIFNMLVPIASEYDASKFPRRQLGEQGCLYNSRFPGFFDVICPDSGQDSAAFGKALSRYRHVLIAGDAFDKAKFDSAALAAFEKAGGKVYRYPSPDCPTPEALERLLMEICEETMPFAVEGDIQWGVNKTENGWLVYLINNKGVIKFCDEPEEYDLSKTAKVSVRFKATGETRTAEVKPGDFRLMEFQEGGDLSVALNELNRYWRLITGDAKSMPVRLRLDPSVSKSGNDAYAIVSEDGTAVISGSNVRSVLYGVYDLLERRGGCGWFWDGDRIQKKKSIDVSGLDVHEESKFAYRGIRYFAHRGLSRFQAEHWGFEDWKREIDWCLKKRLNLFMLRIGQDDLFQKSFPDVCGYPDATKALPGQGTGYDNRSLFWSLEFRGELRRKVMEYAFRRGLMSPSDFGTMTHWYSRTPQDFIDRMKPEFLPQTPGAYGEPSGLVWDIRKPKWMDAYWRLTDTDIREYGRPGLLHTIGIAERQVSTNREENLAMKVELTQSILSEAKRRHPGSTRLLAGWDLYCMKKPEEVKAFLKHIPTDVVIWDYEADASINTWFGEWDIVGRRPYVFGVFMAYEAGLDSRTDYTKIAARQKLVADDPMCKGYILWPESSHVDSVGIEWFAKNAWRADAPAVRPVVEDYCARRYPGEAEAMADLWMKTIPVSTNMQNVWRWNAFLPILRDMGEGLITEERRNRWPEAKRKGFFAALPEVVATLKSLDWDKDEFLKRDMMDIARVWADRVAVDAENAMLREYFKWLDGDRQAEGRFAELVEVAYARLDALAVLLAQHTDFSLCDTYDRLVREHPVSCPGFMSVLTDNSANFYCTSHHAELARHCYLSAFRRFTDLLKAKMASGDRTPLERFALEDVRRRAIAMSYQELKLDAPRSRESFNAALDMVLKASGEGNAVGRQSKSTR